MAGREYTGVVISISSRDWLFSRQRFWGEPFPIVWEEGGHASVTECELPVLPPELKDYKPTPDGEPPLARATDWLAHPSGATRETNTMPQWAGSCWYYLRYLDASNDEAFCGKEAEAYWMGNRTEEATPGVDLYVGGTSMRYCTCFTPVFAKVLRGLGLTSCREPLQARQPGLILGEDRRNVLTEEWGQSG